MTPLEHDFAAGVILGNIEHLKGMTRFKGLNENIDTMVKGVSYFNPLRYDPVFLPGGPGLSFSSQIDIARQIISLILFIIAPSFQTLVSHSDETYFWTIFGV